MLGQPPRRQTLVQLTPTLSDELQRRLHGGYRIVDWQ
jgi:hypothetical protein